MIVPAAWIASALLAAGNAFGGVAHGPVRVIVKPLRAHTLGEAGRSRLHPKIFLSPRALGVKERVQCVLIHEYGHLRGRGHSRNPRSIMFFRLNPATCHAWLRRHHVA